MAWQPPPTQWPGSRHQLNDRAAATSSKWSGSLHQLHEINFSWQYIFKSIIKISFNPVLFYYAIENIL
jgi:hypothetical protein